MYTHTLIIHLNIYVIYNASLYKEEKNGKILRRFLFICLFIFSTNKKTHSLCTEDVEK